MRNTGDSSGNVTIEGRRKDTDADDLVANVVLKAGEQQQGQHAFSPLGGAGYYWQIDCDACSWSLTLTPL